MSNSKAEKVTRVMKVTATEETFERFDSGDLKSNGGLRRDDGKLGALVDIENISPEEAMASEYVSDPVPVAVEEPESAHSQSDESSVIGEIIMKGLEVLWNIFQDPEVQESIRTAKEALMEYKIRPWFNRKKDIIIKRIKRQSPNPDMEIPTQTECDSSASGLLPADDNGGVDNVQFSVSAETAELMIARLRDDVEEITKLIYLLTHLTIEDDQSEHSKQLQQEYLSALMTDKMHRTMKAISENATLFDSDSVVCITSFLDGYLRNEDELIPIPNFQLHEGIDAEE